MTSLKNKIIDELSDEPFFIKTRSGNVLSCEKTKGQWFLQGQRVTKKETIDLIHAEYAKNKENISKEYDNILKDLENYDIWDSGNLSIIQQKILNFLIQEKIAKKEKGIPGIHDTFNGTAKYIYSLNNPIKESEEEAQKHRLLNRKKSDAAKIAWKKHHYSYMRANRQKERNMENKTFYSLAKELGDKLTEESIIRDNVFDKQLDLSFDTITGGFSMGIKDGVVSFSCSLQETGSGSYALQEGNIENLYNSLKEDLQNICKMVDDEMRQIIAKNGLKSTK